ncbi:MAG: hypothetical protein JWQ23_512 [Herminiimonas sp.]|nr:hypothetical protein [Herminiimonas sp.]
MNLPWSSYFRTEAIERVKGIEPSSRAWEAFVLPLNYTRMESILRSFHAIRQMLMIRSAIATVRLLLSVANARPLLI